MSVSLMTKIWEACVYKDAPHNVLLVLADHGHDNGRNAYPGVDLIAAKARLSVRAVKYSLRTLEEDRVIVPQNDGSGGRGRITRYFIDLKRVQELHRLHKEEQPNCAWCKTRARIDARNSAASAERVQPAPKGCSQRPPYIDRTTIEPSGNLSAPAGAGERAGSLALTKGSPERFREFRDAWACCMPQGFPAKDQAAAETEFTRQSRALPADELIAAARLHGAAETNRAARYRGNDFRTKLPSNWLRDRGWVGYLDQVRLNIGAQRETETALDRVRVGLGEEIFERLQRCGISEAEMARFEGLIFQEPAQFIASTPFQASRLRDRGPKLVQEFGTDVQIVEKKRA